MAKRWYIKDASYTLPAWNLVAALIDGIYVDGYLFENNIPVLDNTLWISVKPQSWHIVLHTITFTLPNYNNGVVGFLSKTFTWLPGQAHAQSVKILCDGHPYGMGINTLGIGCVITAPIANPVIYDVSFRMEVDI